VRVELPVEVRLTPFCGSSQGTARNAELVGKILEEILHLILRDALKTAALRDPLEDEPKRRLGRAFEGKADAVVFEDAVQSAPSCEGHGGGESVSLLMHGRDALHE